jgi:hypothetical protein
MQVLESAFELTSVAPLGGFVLFHLAEYGRTLAGAGMIGARRSPPVGTLLLEATLVWLPFLFHASYGVVVWRRRRSVAEPSPAGGIGLLVLHRLTAVVAGVFVVHHFVRFRVPILSGRIYPADSIQRLAAELSATHFGMPLVAGLELFGVLAVSYHFAYGLFRLGERRGLDGPGLRMAAAALGVISGGLGAATVIRLATG